MEGQNLWQRHLQVYRLPPKMMKKTGNQHEILRNHTKFEVYPLVNIHKTMENHHFYWKNPL